MAPLSGAHIIAQSLRDLGVTVLFGIVGIPVVEIAEEAINLGIRFIGFRNEQAASYAASAYGYLTGRPGICLVVGGPGVLHAMAGVRLVNMLLCIYLSINGASMVQAHTYYAKMIYCALEGHLVKTDIMCYSDWQLACQCFPTTCARRLLRNPSRIPRCFSRT